MRLFNRRVGGEPCRRPRDVPNRRKGGRKVNVANVCCLRGRRLLHPGHRTCTGLTGRGRPWANCGREYLEQILEANSQNRMRACRAYGWRIVLKGSRLHTQASRSACPRAAPKTRMCRISCSLQLAAPVPPAGAIANNTTIRLASFAG